MTQLIIKEKTTSYYNLIITLRDSIGTINYKLNKTKVEKHHKEFIDLIKLIFVYYYSSPKSYGEDEEEGFYHVQNICYFINTYQDQCIEKCAENEKKCKYYNDDNQDHKSSKFALHIPYQSGDCHRHISSLKIEYVDENSKIHDVEIEFDDNDINDIIARIKKAHTIGYEYVYARLCSWEPKIFLKTHQKIKKKPATKN